MKKFKQTIADNLWLLKLCYKAYPSYVIMYIVETIRNEIVVYLEFTFGLNFVLECAEYGKSFKTVAVFLCVLLAFVTFV